MSSRSTNSANTSGALLKHTRNSSSPRITKILPPTLKQRLSPHWRFSLEFGKERQYSRMESTFMTDFRQPIVDCRVCLGKTLERCSLLAKSQISAHQPFQEKTL